MSANVNSFLPLTARLWNSLPQECFLLTYDLNGFKSRIDRHILSLGEYYIMWGYWDIFSLKILFCPPKNK